MNSENRAIRALLYSMGPRRAESFIRAFDLRDDEANYIIDQEVKRLSIQEIADAYNVSQETVKRYRKTGFQKISQQMKDTSETLY